MNTFRKQILISLSAFAMAGVTIAAQAQTTPPAEGRFSHAASQEQRAAKMAEFFAKHQAKIHDALKLTAAQEPAWTAYQAAIKPVAPTAPVAGDRAAFAALSTPARMEKMIAMTKAHEAKMETTLAAVTTFYNVLSADQKKTFDAATMHGHRGHGMRGHMG